MFIQLGIEVNLISVTPTAINAIQLQSMTLLKKIFQVKNQNQPKSDVQKKGRKCETQQHDFLCVMGMKEETEPQGLGHGCGGVGPTGIR